MYKYCYLIVSLNKDWNKYLEKLECLFIFYRAKQIVYAVPSSNSKSTSIHEKSLPEPYAEPFYKDERERKDLYLIFTQEKLKNATKQTH